MINEEKIKEIEQKQRFTSDWFEEALQEIADWKDEQHKQEKQQWIDKVGEWINDNYFEYLQPISCYEQLKNSIDINDFVNDLKKAMKGE